MTRVAFIRGLGLAALASTVNALAQQPEGSQAKSGSPPSGLSLRPQVTIQTNMGSFTVELDAQQTPLTSMNFLDYIESGFYKDTIFHRVLKGRMIHGGGYTRDLKLKEAGLREPIKYEGNATGVYHTRGTLAAYRRFDNLDSAQSQFFINTDTNENLDRLKDGSSYTIFGRVVEGMDVVEKIENVPVGTSPALAAGLLPYIPKDPVVIESTRIVVPLDRARAEETARLNVQAATDPVGFRVQQLENECKSKAIQTNTGLRFIECRPGNGAIPLGPDTVEINYVGTLVNGAEFDSSKARGEGPFVIKVEEAIRGLREGLQKMRENGRTIFIVPPELGFGSEGVPGKVPPGGTLFFDVELVNVKPAL